MKRIIAPILALSLIIGSCVVGPNKHMKDHHNLNKADFKNLSNNLKPSKGVLKRSYEVAKILLPMLAARKVAGQYSSQYSSITAGNSLTALQNPQSNLLAFPLAFTVLYQNGPNGPFGNSDGLISVYSTINGDRLGFDWDIGTIREDTPCAVLPTSNATVVSVLLNTVTSGGLNRIRLVNVDGVTSNEICNKMIFTDLGENTCTSADSNGTHLIFTGRKNSDSGGYTVVRLSDCTVTQQPSIAINNVFIRETVGTAITYDVDGRSGFLAISDAPSPIEHEKYLFEFDEFGNVIQDARFRYTPAADLKVDDIVVYSDNATDTSFLCGVEKPSDRSFGTMWCVDRFDLSDMICSREFPDLSGNFTNIDTNMAINYNPIEQVLEIGGSYSNGQGYIVRVTPPHISILCEPVQPALSVSSPGNAHAVTGFVSLYPFLDFFYAIAPAYKGIFQQNVTDIIRIESFASDFIGNCSTAVTRFIITSLNNIANQISETPSWFISTNNPFRVVDASILLERTNLSESCLTTAAPTQYPSSSPTGTTHSPTRKRSSSSSEDDSDSCFDRGDSCDQIKCVFKVEDCDAAWAYAGVIIGLGSIIIIILAIWIGCCGQRWNNSQNVKNHEILQEGTEIQPIAGPTFDGGEFPTGIAGM